MIFKKLVYYSIYQLFFVVAYGWKDDIDIEDPKEKPRGYPVIAGLNRQNITNKFQAIKGKSRIALKNS